jgi:pimeloyl-ACP methyl ester carboxylesterase
MKTLTILALFLVFGSARCLAAPAWGQEVKIVGERTLELGSQEIQAQKGLLTVPENRSKEDSRTIDLTFVRLLSTADEPGCPLFFLPGGPGHGATQQAGSAVWLKFLELGDVVLLDPRGCGESEPDLDFDSDTLDPFLFFADRDTAVQHMAQVCREAAQHFEAKGVDLAGYNTNEMADDLEALREGLEYDQVAVMGHSFGTLLGQVWIRRSPGAVARFVSVGTAGPYDMMKRPSQLDRSLRRVSKLVAADPVAGADVPELFSDIEDAVAVVEESPLVVELLSNVGPVDVEVGPFGVQMILWAELGDTSDLPVYPRLVRTIQERDTGMIHWFLTKRIRALSRLPVLLLYCRGAAGATQERWAAVREEAEICPFGLARCLFSPEADLALGVVDLGDAFREPVKSDVPTLFVSGILDAQTPPEQAEKVRQGFPNSGHLLVEYCGHDDMMPDPEVQDAIVRFLGGKKPEDGTITRPPLRFAPIYGEVNQDWHPSLPMGSGG